MVISFDPELLCRHGGACLARLAFRLAADADGVRIGVERNIG